MKMNELLEEVEKANSAVTGPILVNMNQYAVLIRTPEGNFINLAGNCRAAVRGPGFEQYIENRILMQAGADYSGPILYTSGKTVPQVFSFSSREVVQKPVEEMVKITELLRPITEMEAVAYGVVRPTAPIFAPSKTLPVFEEVMDFGPATADGSPLPAAEASSKFLAEVKAAESHHGIPVGAPTLPSKRHLQAMKYKDLVQVFERLKLPTTGLSRQQMLNKLLPLAKD